ncbi:MAG: methionyl-tRNA formyltransferase, partial [Daejeonella sp.]
GLSPYPTAFTNFQDKSLKIFRAEMEKGGEGIAPGTYLTDHKKYLKFACTDGFIYIHDLQIEGKKRMNIGDFLRGMKF